MRRSSLLAIVGFLLLGIAAAVLVAAQRPTRLKVAVGPDEREHAQLIAAFARKLAHESAPVRLTLVRKMGFAELAAAVDTGEADLAVVRSDLMPKHALTLAVLREFPLVLVPAAGVRLKDLGDLAGRRLGVARGSGDNLVLVQGLLRAAGLESGALELVPLAPEALAPALATRRVDAVLPLGAGTGFEWVSHARAAALFATPEGRARGLLAIPEAEALAARDPAFAAVELPRGALLTRPAVPDEALTTLAVTQRLVARTDLADNVVAELTRLLFTGRTALAAEAPSAKAVHAPETDTGEALGAALPLHPGAAAYLSGEQQTFWDRYGDLVYVGGMVVTTLASGLGALASYVVAARRRDTAKFTRRLLDLLQRARRAGAPGELDAVERDADELLALAFASLSSGAIGHEQFDTFATLNDSVHQAIERRTRQLSAAPAGALAG